MERQIGMCRKIERYRIEEDRRISGEE